MRKEKRKKVKYLSGNNQSIVCVSFSRAESQPRRDRLRVASIVLLKVLLKTRTASRRSSRRPTHRMAANQPVQHPDDRARLLLRGHQPGLHQGHRGRLRSRHQISQVGVGGQRIGSAVENGLGSDGLYVPNDGHRFNRGVGQTVDEDVQRKDPLQRLSAA